MKVWKLPSLVPVATLRGHKRGVWCVEFSPVDQAVITASGARARPAAVEAGAGAHPERGAGCHAGAGIDRLLRSCLVRCQVRCIFWSGAPSNKHPAGPRQGTA